MAIALVAHTAKMGASSTSAIVSDAIDTTGATLLVIAACTYTESATTVSDSKANTWVPLTEYADYVQGGGIRFYYSYNKAGAALSVGSGHTFQFNCGASDYKTIVVLAFSGTLTEASDPFDKQNGNALRSARYITTNSVTPSESEEVLIAGYADGISSNVNAAIDSSLIVAETAHNGSDMSGAMAYRVYSSTAAISPIWDVNVSGTKVANIATFKAAAAGGSSILRQMMAHHE